MILIIMWVVQYHSEVTLCLCIWIFTQCRRTKTGRTSGGKNESKNHWCVWPEWTGKRESCGKTCVSVRQEHIDCQEGAAGMWLSAHLCESGTNYSITSSQSNHYGQIITWSERSRSEPNVCLSPLRQRWRGGGWNMVWGQVDQASRKEKKVMHLK